MYSIMNENRLRIKNIILKSQIVKDRKSTINFQTKDSKLCCNIKRIRNISVFSKATLET